MKSVQFRREREESWGELERLLERAESDGLHSLAADELRRLPVLYRAALSSLSVARAISLDQNVLEYLQSLSARAYFAVYGAKRPFGEALREYFAERFPRAVRTHVRQVLLAALVMAAGIVTGRALMAANPDHFYALVSEGYAQGRGPASTTEDLRAVLYRRGDALVGLTAFATALFTHNARIGMLCASLGFAAGVPTLLLLFYNGLIVGAFAGLYEQRGLGPELWAWLLPHGITELLAVILCGAAGLVIGDSLLFPGRHARLVNLARQGAAAGQLVVGAVALFLVAGLIEGLFRQLVHDVAVRYATALTSAVFWLVYFTWAGREERR
jgi:uncharacterized membrane protein SpoIIM required for sporulation